MEKKILVVWNGATGPEISIQRESEYFDFACKVNRELKTTVKTYDAETFNPVKRFYWVS
jgi:hypothetical protein